MFCRRVFWLLISPEIIITINLIFVQIRQINPIFYSGLVSIHLPFLSICMIQTNILFDYKQAKKVGAENGRLHQTKIISFSNSLLSIHEPNLQNLLGKWARKELKFHQVPLGGAWMNRMWYTVLCKKNFPPLKVNNIFIFF